MFQASDSAQPHLDVVALEEVQVRLALPRLLAHQGQDGVIAAGVHHRLAVLEGADGEVLQLILKRGGGALPMGLVTIASKGL